MWTHCWQMWDIIMNLGKNLWQFFERSKLFEKWAYMDVNLLYLKTIRTFLQNGDTTTKSVNNSKSEETFF